MNTSRLSDHLEKLNHFVGVVQQGSMRRYSSERNIAQSAVSKSLQALESVLECNLLVRGREGVKLTQEGKSLFKFAESLLSRTREIELMIRSSGKLKLSGRLTMGTYSSVAVYFLPSLLKFIERQQPQLELSFVVAPSAELVRQLRAGALDFIVSINPPQSRDLHSLIIYSDSYSLYRKCGDQRGLDEVRVFTYLPATDRTGKTVESYLNSARPKVKVLSCGDFESAKSMVEHGVGFALLPDRVAAVLVANQYIERVPRTPTLQTIADHDIEFSCRKHRAADSSLQWVEAQILLMLRARP